MMPLTSQPHLEHNTRRLRAAILTCVIALILCGVGVVVARVYWDSGMRTVYSFTLRTNTRVGWPSTLQSWSVLLGIGLIVTIPLLVKLLLAKHLPLRLTDEGLVINQQLLRNVLVPYTNIARVFQAQDMWRVEFRDEDQLLQQLGKVRRAFVTANLKREPFGIDPVFNRGDIEGFVRQLQARVDAGSGSQS